MRARALAIGLLLALVAGPVAAQDVRIERKPPVREPGAEVIPPGMHYEKTRPAERSNYPDGPLVEHDPAFIEPLAASYESGGSTGRAGLSGWTSPATPVGPAIAGYRDVNGWLGFGFSVTWGGPPPVARRPAR